VSPRHVPAPRRRVPRPAAGRVGRTGAVAALLVGGLLLPVVTAPSALATEDAAAAVAAALPDALAEELSARQTAQLAGALVDDAGTADGVATAAAGVRHVEVAVTTDDGGLEVAAVAVEAPRAGAVVDLLGGLPSVEAAGVAHRLDVGDPVPVTATSVAPGRAGDPYVGEQWALPALDADRLRASRIAVPVVAVVDSGVDAGHPDLAGSVRRGYDALTRQPGGTTDKHGHGTHVAGVVAATIGNGVGVAGLVRADVLPVRVLSSAGVGDTTKAADGVVWATDHGADVINMSLGGPESSDVLARAVRYAIEHGVVVVAAMGNEGAEGSPTSYPAAYPGVVAVAAVDRRRATASFSSRGAHADLAAPGVGILSTYKGGTYAYLDGTSMAAPYVAASAAVLAATVPSASPAAVQRALLETAVDLGPRGRDVATGYGFVDPTGALARLRDGGPPRQCLAGVRPTEVG